VNSTELVGTADAGTRDDVAVLQVMEQLRVEHRVRLEQLVVGLLQTEPGGISRQQLEHRLQNRPLHRLGQERPLAADDVGGHPEHVLRDEPVPAAHTDRGALRRARRVARDVAGRVAPADDQHALAGELRR
jgi:hypothetical protein